MRIHWPWRPATQACMAIMMIIGTLGKTGFVSAEEWRRPVLEVFVRGESERSQAAREFVKKNYGERPGVLLVIRDVTTSEKDLARFWKLADHFGHAKPQLPAFYVSGQFESGWDATTTPIRLEEALTIEVFTRQGCPRCAEAKPILFKTLAARYPGYRFVERDVAATESARKRLSELSQRYRVQATSVPAVHVCGRLMVGFTDTGTNLRQWDEVLRAVTIQAADGESAPEPTSSLQKTLRRPVGALHWFESVVHAGEPPIDQDRETTSPPSPPVIKDLSDDETIDRPKRGLPPETSDESEPSLIPATPGITAPEVVELPVLGSVRWRDWGFPAFTFAVGLIDGFNPCAMWVLLFLLSMLVNLRDRWKILAVAGTFVFISGAAYYAFMAAWLSIFEIVGFLRPAQITLGLIGITIGVINVKDFFAFKEGISLSIPESAKPGLYARIRRIVLAKSIGSAIAGASVVAVLVNIIELLCTAGLPAMYTSILNSQNLPWWQDHLYLLLYIIAYMFDDSLMVAGVVITLDKFKLQERGGRILKLISGVVVLALGLTMLLKPEWLV